MGENYCKTPCPGTVMYRHSQIPFLSVRVHRGRLRVLRQQRLRPRLPGRPRPLRRPRQGGRHLRVDRHRQLSLGLRVGPGKAHRRRHGHELHDARSPLQLGPGLSLPSSSVQATLFFLCVCFSRRRKRWTWARARRSSDWRFTSRRPPSASGTV